MNNKLIPLSLSVLLTACGGGGGGSPEVKTEKPIEKLTTSVLPSGMYLTTLSDAQDILRADNASARFVGVAVILSEEESETKKSSQLFGHTLESSIPSGAENRRSLNFMAESEIENGVTTSQFLWWDSASQANEGTPAASSLSVMPSAAPETLKHQWLPELDKMGISAVGQTLSKAMKDGTSFLLLQNVKTISATEFLEASPQAKWKASAEQTYAGDYNQYQLNYFGSEQITVNADIDGACNIAANGELVENNLWIFSSDPMNPLWVDSCRAKLEVLWQNQSADDREQRIRLITEKPHSLAIALLSNSNGEPILAVSHIIMADDLNSMTFDPINVNGHGLFNLTH